MPEPYSGSLNNLLHESLMLLVVLYYNRRHQYVGMNRKERIDKDLINPEDMYVAER